jgi:dihydrofolate reductase
MLSSPVRRDRAESRLSARIAIELLNWKETHFMQRVVAGASISLDGYSAGPNIGISNPMGDGGSLLHEWILQTDGADRELIEHNPEGAVIIGRTMFDLGEKPWGENPPFHLPVFVLTHNPQDMVVKDGGTTFTFVSDGIESALQQARAAAGDRDVAVGGGATTVQQFLRAGLLDQLQIHLIPVVLGGGVRFFEETGRPPIQMERVKVMVSPGVTHLWFRPKK